MTKIPYIIWDWNGTLLDDVDAAVAALNRMLVSRGVEPTDRDYYRENFGFPVRPFYAQLGVDLAREDWDRICIDFHRFVKDEVSQHLRGDAIDALALVKDAGVKQSILSALRQDILRRDVKYTGISGFFDEVFGVDNLDGATKLDRGRDLMKHLSCKHPDFMSRHEIYFIGDTLHDAEVARELGGTPILVDNGHQTHERLSASGAVTVPSLVCAIKECIASKSRACPT